MISRDASVMRVFLLGQALITHDRRTTTYGGYNELAEHLSTADVCFSDLEVALICPDAGSPTKHGTYLHTADQAVLECLNELSVNLLALCNNHAWDLGTDGIVATEREVSRRGIAHAGTGESIDTASAPVLLPTENGNVALVAMAAKVRPDSIATATRAGVNHLAVVDGVPSPYDARRNLDAIAAAARTADVVLAYVHNHHWESDWRRPPEWLHRWARDCIDAGASAFVAHGVPILHGIEMYRGRPIFLCLGNFFFDTRTPVGTYPRAVWQSVIGECTFSAGELADFVLRPIVLTEGDPERGFFETRGAPRLLDDDEGGRGGYEADMILRNLAHISAPYGTRITVKDGRGEVRLDR